MAVGDVAPPTAAPESSDHVQDRDRSTREPRLLWVDNIRLLVILLVVNVHACVTYSHVGSWYYTSDDDPPILLKIGFVFWQAHMQAFLMGVLFFFGGLFAEKSLRRRGVAAFLKERMRRLGLPTLLFTFLLGPPLIFFMLPNYRGKPFVPQIEHYLQTGIFIRSTGPMWFAEALLLFSAVYALAPRFSSSKPREITPITLLKIVIATGIVTFLVRLSQPIGYDIANFQLCYFTQYVVTFALGIRVASTGELEKIARSQFAKRAGIVAMIAGPLSLALIALLILPIVPHAPLKFVGGWNLVAFLLSIWEQVIGFGLGLGMISFCYRHLKTQNQLVKWAEERAFAVYVIHPAILVATAVFIVPLHGNPYPLALLLAVLGTIFSFLIADVVRRVPGLKAIL